MPAGTFVSFHTPVELVFAVLAEPETVTVATAFWSSLPVWSKTTPERVPVVPEPAQLAAGDQPRLACGDAFPEQDDGRHPERMAETSRRTPYSVHNPRVVCVSGIPGPRSGIRPA